ncbi:type VII secretion target [Amycolatopsis jejuensis]|uniref:type VII secretion target n=1 Tax=Amycolatopsis jejuensis TaxID=330084 RepID=UPI00052657B4|nr:type VII secretion target [Amycolatopsis jejuensis]
MTGSKVDLPALRAHQGEVEDIAAGVHTAAQATASGQSFGDDAFGLVGQVFAAPLQIWMSVATSFVQDVAGAADSIADRLKQAHDHFDHHEKQTVGHIKGLGKELPE